MFKKKKILASSKASITYQAAVLVSNPSNYWKLDETSGTTAIDSVGGANGTISGGVILNQAGGISSGKSMLFDGTTGKIVTVAPPMLTPFTLEWWMKTTFSGAERPIISTRSGSGGGNFVVTQTGTGTIYLFSSAGGTGATLASINNGQWHHVALILNTTNAVIIYIDGVVFNGNFDTSAYGTGSNTRPLELAADTSGGSTVWPGSIDEVAIYPRVLTPAEILAHYNAR